MDSIFWLSKQLFGLLLIIGGIALAIVVAGQIFLAFQSLLERLEPFFRGLVLAIAYPIVYLIYAVKLITPKGRTAWKARRARRETEEERLEPVAKRLMARGMSRRAARMVAKNRLLLGYDS